MKVLLGCIVIALLWGVCGHAYSQNGTSSISGKASTTDNIPAEAATVILLKAPDSAVVKATISNAAGAFNFSAVKPGSYFILIHKIGYRRFYTAQFSAPASKEVNIGTIKLAVLNNQLAEVTVTDKRDYIEIRPDKTVLNVDKSILATGNSVFDVLQTAPGVRVTDNQVLLKGGQKALIAINGKPIGMMADDQLTELLKSYQSSNVSQIELIENPSAKYDAAGGGGVINIILKKSKDLGFKANITESAAVGQDYKLNTGLNLNYRTKKFNFSGNYSLADNQTARSLEVDRLIRHNDTVSSIDLFYNSTTHIVTNNFNVSADFTPTPKQTVGVLMYGYHNQAGIDKSNATFLENNEHLDSTITSASHINRGITNLNYNVNYKGSFGNDNAVTLTADVDYSTYKRASDELLANDFFDANNIPYRASLFYRDESPSHINVRSERIDMVQILSKKDIISAGLKNNQVKSDNMIDFLQSTDTGKTYTKVPILTDHFLYNERINSAYFNYFHSFDKFSVTFGMRAEQTNSFGESLNPDRTSLRSYLGLFPNVQLTKAVDKDNVLSLNYNRRTDRPNYQDLNPFVAYIDKYSYSTGNPFLKPEYFNTYELSDLIKEKYKVAVSMIITTDFFAPVFQQNDETKIYTTTTSNLGKRYEYLAELTLPFTFTKWWQANVYLNADYERFIYNADSARKSTYDLQLQVTQNFTIAPGLKAEVYGTYESPTYYGIKQYKAQWSARAAISKAVLNNNGSIRLAVTDIFNSDIYKYNSHYLNLDLTGREKSGTRFASLSFTYRFGKQSVKNARRRNGGNMDEQLRLNGSSNEN